MDSGTVGAMPDAAVVGSGYVGTVVAAAIVSMGGSAVGLESDRDKLAVLRSGRAPFREPGLDEAISAGLASGRLRFTSDPSEAMERSRVVFLCVGTPSGPGGRPDVEAVAAAGRAIGGAGSGDHVLVTKSTVPIGSARWLASLLEEIGCEMPIVSNPEFLREGSALHDFLHPDRIVLGSDDPRALETVVELYRPVLEQRFPGGDPRRQPPLVRTNLVTAETVKYAANAFLATKISFINEVANICELVGADVSEVATALGLDARIGPQFLQPGIGWGGSCFGKDLAALVATAEECGYEAPLLRATIAVNHRQRSLIIEKLQRRLQVLRGHRVAVLGLTFKPGTDDTRDSPAVEVVRRLVDLGVVVSAYDPLVPRLDGLDAVRFARDPYDAVERVDAVVVATDWPEFALLDLASIAARMRGQLLVDGRNLFDPASVAAAGLVYDCVGRTMAALPSVSAQR
jgi:nucleotide sugar dehydrogenase